MFIVSLLSAVCIAAASSSAELFTTTAGRQVPVSDLTRVLRGTPRHEWHSRIVELTADHRHLVTHSDKLPLVNASFETRLFKPEHGVPVVIDGEPLQQTVFRYLTRTVPSFTVSYRLDGTAFSVASRTAVLRPLHATAHPGVFVDVPPAVGGPDDDGGLPIPDRPPTTNGSGYDPALSRAPCRRGDPQLQFDLAAAFDSTLCNAYGDYRTTLAALTDALHMGMLPFHRQTCLRLKVVYYEGFCDVSKDPYAEMVARENTVALMADLRKLWYARRAGVARDVVYLFSNFGSDDAVGRAYFGAVCNREYNVVWTEALLVSTIAHELGHAFDAVHTTGRDIMSPDRDRYGSRFFGEGTLSTMESFIGAHGSCLSPYTRKNPIVVPSNNQRTCESGYVSGVPKNRDWIYIQTISYAFDAGTANLDVYVYQWEKELTVYLWADAGHRIVQYRRRPAMKKIRKKALGQWVKLGSDSSEETSSLWSWSEIDRPSSMATCCGQIVFIHVQLRLCNNNGKGQCLTSFKVAKHRVQC